MKKLILMLLMSGTIMASAVSNNMISGNWEGNLNVGATTLKILLHIDSDNKKVLMDSPYQGAFNIDCITNYISNDSVNISIPKLMLSYAGKHENDKIIGTFRQGGLSLPLSFERVDEKPASTEAESITESTPYTTEEVTFFNPQGNCTLSGTLTIPDGFTEETPVVVMVTGSGLQNRDEELMGHKPFALIADKLAHQGIATLRYDDRGFGKSTGDGMIATTEDFASDAETAIKWLRKNKNFGKVGLLGHSEGGMIAYMLGAKEKSILSPDFIISIAGPAVKGTVTIADQNRYALISSGIANDEAGKFAESLKNLLERLASTTEVQDITSTEIASLSTLPADSPLNSVFVTTAESMVKSITDNPWLKYFLQYDPAEDLRKLSIPTLILYGEKDRQVSSSINVSIARSCSPEADIREMPGLNHLMQTAETGSVAEYITIKETMSPTAIEAIISFIKGAVK